MKQMHDRDAMEPLAYGSLKSEQKREALISLILSKEKRDGSIKGRL